IGYLTRRRSRYALQQHHVILPAVVKSRSPATEGDFNIHKSNSTYITDLDVSRAHLSGLLFGPFFLQNTFSMRCNLIVSAIACTFHREIKPFQPYEICTRVASWDDKWIYMVTHFVDNSTTEQTKTVFASAVTRMVFKRGRLTVPPDRALEICGLLSTADSTTASSNLDTGTGTTDSAAGFGFRELKLREMISYKETNLPIVRLERGWDAVRELFREEQLVLAEYVDFMW
ncbi:hypothetical protein ASPBRDRAFT_138824, partial [Aspergillus brasiliensis CBS 101740]